MQRDSERERTQKWRQAEWERVCREGQRRGERTKKKALTKINIEVKNNSIIHSLMSGLEEQTPTKRDRMR